MMKKIIVFIVMMLTVTFGYSQLYSINSGGSAQTICVNDYLSGYHNFTNIVKVKEIIKDNDFSVYPNPCSDYLNVNVDIDVNDIKIFDISGRLVLSDNTNRFFVGDLLSGIYIIIVNNEYKYKFIKK